MITINRDGKAIKEWSQTEIDTLRNMWAKNTASKIGKLLNRSRGSIISKANRLGLPAKGTSWEASPRRPWTQSEIDTISRMWSGHTAKEIARVLGRSRDAVIGRGHRMGLPQKTPGGNAQPRPRADPRPRSRKPFRRTIPPGFIAPSDGCQYPHGNPGEQGFHFCGSTPVVRGKSYCPTHAALCYAPPKEQAA